MRWIDPLNEIEQFAFAIKQMTVHELNFFANNLKSLPKCHAMVMAEIRKRPITKIVRKWT